MPNSDAAAISSGDAMEGSLNMNEDTTNAGRGNVKKGKEIVATFNTMKELRYPLDKAYERGYRMSYPHMGQGFNWRQETMDSKQQGRVADVWQDDMMTTEGPKTVRLLASAILSALTPTSTRWFDFEIPGVKWDDLPNDVKEWLDMAADIVWDKINTSNYDAESLSFALHVVIAGIAGLMIDWRPDLVDGPGLHFESQPISVLYFAESLGNGFIDTVYMSLRRTVIRLVNEYGLKNLPDHLQKEYLDNPHSEKEHVIIWAIRPRLKGGKQSKGKLKLNKPFESVLVVKDGGFCICEDGFDEFPMVAPRWSKIPGSVYARGPFYSALPNILTMNEIWRLKLESADLACAGAWKATDDGVLNPNTLRIEGRVIIPVGDINNLVKLDAGGDIMISDKQIEVLGIATEQIMMTDQLSPSEKSIQTAAEVQANANKTRQALGPVFSGMQREFIKPMVERCFALCQRAKVLPDFPPSLKDKKMVVGFRSPLARAQQLNDMAAIDQVITRADTYAQADPGVLDNLDMDKVLRLTVDLNSADPSILRDEDEVKSIRAARAKQQQETAQQEAMAQGTQAPPQKQTNEPLPNASYNANPAGQG